jgi:hypothetical protein
MGAALLVLGGRAVMSMMLCEPEEEEVLVWSVVLVIELIAVERVLVVAVERKLVEVEVDVVLGIGEGVPDGVVVRVLEVVPTAVVGVGDGECKVVVVTGGSGVGGGAIVVGDGAIVTVAAADVDVAVQSGYGHQSNVLVLVGRACRRCGSRLLMGARDREARVGREDEVDGAGLDAERREVRDGVVEREAGGDERAAPDEVRGWRVVVARDAGAARVLPEGCGADYALPSACVRAGVPQQQTHIAVAAAGGARRREW